MGFTLGRPDVVAALAKLKSLPRLRHLPADPDRLDRRAARGRRLPGRGLRDLPQPPRRALLRPRPRRLARRAAEGDDVRLGADPRAAAPSSARWSSRSKLAREADVAVSPGIGFGPGGDGHVRFALVENEQRIGQATRSIRRLLQGLSVTRSPLLPTPSRRGARTWRRRRACSAARAAVQLGERGARARRPGCRGRAGALSTSSTIVSPSRTRGDRAAARTASGAMWPTIRPCVAPEKRPSVISATSSPSPSPTSARGDVQHLAHARARRPGPRSGSRRRRRARSRAP